MLGYHLHQSRMSARGEERANPNPHPHLLGLCQIKGRQLLLLPWTQAMPKGALLGPSMKRRNSRSGDFGSVPATTEAVVSRGASPQSGSQGYSNRHGPVTGVLQSQRYCGYMAPTWKHSYSTKFNSDGWIVENSHLLIGCEAWWLLHSIQGHGPTLVPRMYQPAGREKMPSVGNEAEIRRQSWI